MRWDEDGIGGLNLFTGRGIRMGRDRAETKRIFLASIVGCLSKCDVTMCVYETMSGIVR